MEFVWTLMLTVCGTDICFSQPVESYKNQNVCLQDVQEHVNIPEDGPWRSVKFQCIIPGAKKI